MVPRQLEDFVDKRIGTVHTTQGKEADVVILVLGTDPGRAKKAQETGSVIRSTCSTWR